MALSSNLQDTLNSIISDALITEKTASDSSTSIEPVSFTSEDSSNLVKVASILRTVSVEPTYEDLYNFVGGLHGRR